MKNIFILGAGSFGTALAITFAKQNNITILDRNTDVTKDININHKNSRYTTVKLPKNIQATTKIEEAKNAEIIIICVPSSHIKDACKELKKYYNKQIIISATKGVSEKSETMTDCIEGILKANPNNVFALSGPSLADELAHGEPTEVVLGGDKRKANILKKHLQSENFFIRTTTDKTGIQLLGFYKNLIAIIVGLCHGAKIKHNFQSALVTKAYRDFYYRNIDRIRRHTFVDYAGLGDLFVTTTATNSRNHTFGVLLAKGMTVPEIKIKIGQVIEGLNGFEILKKTKKNKHIDPHIICLFDNIINYKKDVKEELLAYLKKEQHCHLPNLK